VQSFVQRKPFKPYRPIDDEDEGDEGEIIEIVKAVLKECKKKKSKSVRGDESGNVMIDSEICRSRYVHAVMKEWQQRGIIA